MATNVDAKLLKQTKFPPEFSQKVDMKKVNVEVMKKLNLRELPRMPSVTKSKKGPGKRTLIISGSESGPNEDGVAEEETEVTMNTTDALAGIRDLHLQGADRRRTEMISVALQGVTS
ncbi:MAG: hypothetical protein Q9211_003631 [Gyalolechia sp. 1 TL-2023]